MQDARQKFSHEFVKISRAKNFSPHMASRVSPNRSPNATTTRLTRLSGTNLNRFSVLTVEESNDDESEERDKRQLIQSSSNQNKGRISKQSKNTKQDNRLDKTK